MRGRKLVLRVLGVLVVLLVVLVGVGWYLARLPFPTTQGRLTVPGLQAPVTVYRDAYGIPHIYASTVEDLFFAQGFVHAQDRFWQMDVWRHIGMGRLAEMFGESQVETDMFLRTLGWERLARQEYEMLSPEARRVLEAYARGVNAYLERRQGSRLSLEYTVLKLLNPDYRPPKWEPIHSLVWAHVMAWDLGGNMKQEIERAVLLTQTDLTPEMVDRLYPPYPYDRHPVIVPEYAGEAARPAGARPPLDLSPLAPLFAQLNARVTALEDVLGPMTEAVGSNSWVLAGSRTATGGPILANDPHLGQQLPSIWYVMGLHCAPVTPDCPYEVAGVTFAGTPGVVIGHNGRIAWGFTNVGPDVMDLYVEKVDPQNPNRYLVDGRWEDMEVYTEVIRVAGGQDVELTIRRTRHGPIISGVYKPLENMKQVPGLEMPEAYAVALRWTALEPMRTLEAILGFNRARNWEDFRQAARLFDAPAQNLLYADVEGNIGYQMPGKIPIRDERHSGVYPVPGWESTYEWKGYIPFEDLPWVFNPPKGYIVTANNPVVGPEYPYRIAPVWAYGYRAQRIVEMIENARGPVTVDMVAAMQMDSRNGLRDVLVPLLADLDMGDAELNRIRDMLQTWDGQMRADSPEAAVFAAFWRNLLARMFHNKLPEDYYPKGGSRWMEVVRTLVQEPNHPLWDDFSTPETETRDDILRAAFRDAVAELKDRLGPNPERWAWGDLHRIYLTHQTLGKSGVAPIERLFNRGPYPVSGDTAVVNNTAWKATQGYEVVTVPSMRLIVDLADLDRTRIIHLTGQSGHAWHPNYTNMTPLWASGQTLPLPWTRPQVEALAQEVLILEP